MCCSCSWRCRVPVHIAAEAAGAVAVAVNVAADTADTTAAVAVAVAVVLAVAVAVAVAVAFFLCPCKVRFLQRLLEPSLPIQKDRLWPLGHPLDLRSQRNRSNPAPEAASPGPSLTIKRNRFSGAAPSRPSLTIKIDLLLPLRRHQIDRLRLLRWHPKDHVSFPVSS